MSTQHIEAYLKQIVVEMKVANFISYAAKSAPNSPKDVHESLRIIRSSVR